MLQPVLVRRRPLGYELPCRVYNVGEQEARVLAEADDLRLRPQVEPRLAIPEAVGALGPALAEVSDSLRAAASCWGMSAGGRDRPYSAAVRDIAAIELQRATWLVEGLRTLSESTATAPSRLMFGSLLDRVLQATDPERRLADITLSLDLSASAVTFRGDEGLLLMAFGGILQAVTAIARPVAPATIRCGVASENAAARVEISQTQADVPPELLARFFDHTYHDRPGGYGAAVGADRGGASDRAARRSRERRTIGSVWLPRRHQASDLGALNSTERSSLFPRHPYPKGHLWPLGSLPRGRL